MIANAAHVRSVGNLPDGVLDTTILPHLRSAKTRLKSWVGDTAYATAEADALAKAYDFSESSECAEATLCLADAEAYLALHFGLASFNRVMQSVGSGASGITMTGMIGENQYRYMNPGEIDKAQQDNLDKAYQAATPYLDGADVPPGPEISYAKDDLGYDMDEDWPDETLA